MRTLAFVVALGLGACTAATDPRPINSVGQFGSLDGHWSGSIGIMEYDAQLVQMGVQLGGTGDIGPTPSSGAEFATRLTTIIGTDRTPQVQFQFQAKSGDSPTFVGVQLSTNEIRGAIGDGSGAGEPLTLYRH
jgi:hypothetical protein